MSVENETVETLKEIVEAQIQWFGKEVADIGEISKCDNFVCELYYGTCDGLNIVFCAEAHKAESEKKFFIMISEQFHGDMVQNIEYPTHHRPPSFGEGMGIHNYPKSDSDEDLAEQHELTALFVELYQKEKDIKE